MPCCSCAAPCRQVYSGCTSLGTGAGLAAVPPSQLTRPAALTASQAVTRSSGRVPWRPFANHTCPPISHRSARRCPQQHQRRGSDADCTREDPPSLRGIAQPVQPSSALEVELWQRSPSSAPDSRVGSRSAAWAASFQPAAGPEPIW